MLAEGSISVLQKRRIGIRSGKPGVVDMRFELFHRAVDKGCLAAGFIELPQAEGVYNEDTRLLRGHELGREKHARTRKGRRQVAGKQRRGWRGAQGAVLSRAAGRRPALCWPAAGCWRPDGGGGAALQHAGATAQLLSQAAPRFCRVHA